MFTITDNIHIGESGYFLEDWKVTSQEFRIPDGRELPGHRCSVATNGDFTFESPDIYHRRIKLIAEQPFGVLRENDVTVEAGDYIRVSPSNGFVYKVTTGGTFASTAPTYSETHGSTFSDGTAELTAVKYIGNEADKGKYWQGEYEASGLLGGSKQSTIYVPKPEYLYQDAFGATPVTSDGDLVGLMIDYSGNGNNALQNVPSRKPTYRTDGTLHWLEFSDTDYMWLGFSVLHLEELCVSVAWYGDPADNARLLDSQGTSVPRGFQMKSNSDDNVSDGNGNYISLGSNLSGFGPHVSTQQYKDKTLTTRDDGQFTAEQTNSSVGTIVPEDKQGVMCIDAGTRSTQNFIGNVYGIVVTEVQSTEADITAIETFLADLAGVTL